MTKPRFILSGRWKEVRTLSFRPALRPARLLEGLVMHAAMLHEAIALPCKDLISNTINLVSLYALIKESKIIEDTLTLLEGLARIGKAGR